MKRHRTARQAGSASSGRKRNALLVGQRYHACDLRRRCGIDGDVGEPRRLGTGASIVAQGLVDSVAGTNMLGPDKRPQAIFHLRIDLAIGR